MRGRRAQVTRAETESPSGWPEGDEVRAAHKRRRDRAADHLGLVTSGARDGSLTGVGRAEVLPRGWYQDPYRRWRARYWDGQCWTERVANRGADPTQPQYGTDPLVALPDADRELPAIVEALCGSELARLRAEADHWRLIAEDRQRALDALKPLIDKLGTVEHDGARDDALVGDASKRTDGGLARERPMGVYVAVPAHVREAALHEMAVVEARIRRQQGRRRKKR